MEEGISSLYVSSFRFRGGDTVKKYSDLESTLNSTSMNIETLSHEIVWPNEIEKFPRLIDGDDHYVVASGFFPPTKNLGGIYLINKKDKNLKKISKDKKGWWYHRTRFWDYDGDGRLDIITAKAFKGMIWGKGAELIALLAPDGKSRTEWEEKILFKGPDVFFELVDFNNDGDFEVISSQFLNEKISYHFRESKNGQWKERIIDDSIGAGFDLSLNDLNSDGRLEILVTNHVASKKAGVFVYEIPDEPKSEEWIKHTIHEGFKTTARGVGQASPGNAKAFEPNPGSGEKLSIVVSGDGTEKVHLFTPVKSEKSDWKYHHEVIYSGKGIMGKVSAFDGDLDGKAEIYIPAYDENKVLVYEY